MAFIDIVRILFSLFITIDAFNLEAQYFENKTCNKLSLDPFFVIDLVVGKPWKIYYVWNFDDKMFFEQCQEVKFKNATSMIINRVWNDMYEYLDTQPEWSSAILLMSIGPSHEMLLFTDDGVPGSFIGVANVLRSNSEVPKVKNSVPLFKLYMKILANGQWMVMSDCNIGVTSLAARGDMELVTDEKSVIQLASSLDIGEGELICFVEPEIRTSTFSDNYINMD